jgi:hypothetical protein
MIMGQTQRIALKPAHDHEMYTRPDRFSIYAHAPYLNSYGSGEENGP